MGSIGTAVAKRARAFDMRVLYHNRNRVSEAEEKLLGRCCNNFEVEGGREGGKEGRKEGGRERANAT